MSDLPAGVTVPSQFPVPGPTNYAVWIDRVIAAVLDLLIVVAVFIVVTIVFGTAFTGLGGLAGALGGNDAAAGALGGLGCLGCISFLFMPLLVYFGVGLYNKVVLVAKRGFSIGQGVAQLRVLTMEGRLVPVGTLVLRLVVMVLFGFIPLLPLLDLLWPLWDEKRQTLHDKAVGTYVIKMPNV